MNPELKIIGHIETPYLTLGECPNNIQDTGPLCTIIVDDSYQDGLLGLEAGQSILYWFDAADRSIARQKAKAGTETKGTFSLRSPHRPNPLGVAVLSIEVIDAGKVTVKGLDCLNGTQLIDIKPAMIREI